MIDPRLIRESPETVRAALERRRSELDLDWIVEIERARREAVQAVEERQAALNTRSAAIGKLAQVRREVHRVGDLLAAEVGRRYRDGDVSVEALLRDDTGR